MGIGERKQPDGNRRKKVTGKKLKDYIDGKEKSKIKLKKAKNSVTAGNERKDFIYDGGGALPLD